jgi:hypothetical protein
MVREIKGFSANAAAEDESEDDEPRIDERAGRPQPLARSVVASRCGVEEFGKLLASEAHRRGFAAADRKAFVTDGAEANWGVWRRHFSAYVESTVKQVARRMKGTEKLWAHGAEPMLTLVADHLSDTPTLNRFWTNRHRQLTGTRHQTAA